MFEGPSMVVAIVLLCTVGWLVNNWIRARHGYPLEDEWGGKTERPSLPDNRQIDLLSQENAELKGKLLRIEERVAVLERIATDKSTRLAEEIENLR
ncbi:hypothetical protein GV829_11475 [Sphingomonas lacunae]|uniref:Uncharacterized protein n=1 Tax=Sphingomonas lacunae TaxID=2698828 RepID=A0A6M4AV92_9SPHN|nr:hypothetical protein [Sphingomonas lacunae]QJQ32984.1 hypothetical protein GV829_11475 [Sphingomonas lacunae]